MKLSVFIMHRTWTVLCAALVLACCASGRADAASGGAQQDGYFHFMQLTDTTTGEAYWVAGVNGHTWQVTQRGIAMRLQSERRSGLYAIARRDFIAHGSVNIRPVGPVSFPVRRYDIDNVNDDVVPCYTGLIIDGVLSGGRELHLRLTLDGLVYHAAGTADASDGFVDHGGAILDQAGISRAFAFPAVTADIPIPFTKSGTWLSVDHVTACEPVMVRDPRVLLARYTEDLPAIALDREDNALLSGHAPFLDVLPFTPELIDDSVGVQLVRTTKIRLDRSIEWSVYQGPIGFAVTTMFDRNNNAISVGRHRGKAPRGAGTYGPESQGSDDVFIHKWSPDGRLQWSTFVGGDSTDFAMCAALDSTGTIYVGCATKSADYPTTANAFIKVKPNDHDRFEGGVFALSSDGSRLIWNTYLSGRDALGDSLSQDNLTKTGAFITDLAYDGVGGLIVGLSQKSPLTMPTTPDAWRTIQRGSTEGLVTRFRSDGTVHWSTLISTTADDWIDCIQNVDRDRTIVLASQSVATSSADSLYEQLETIGVPGAQRTAEGMHGFMYEFDSTGIPRVLCAPFTTTRSAGVYGMHPRPFLGARTILYLPQNSSTADAIFDRPDCFGISPTVSAYDLTMLSSPKITWTSSLLGIDEDDKIYTEPTVRHSRSVILAKQRRFPGRGACLTDTVWGSGFGDGDDYRGYLVIIRRSLTSSAEPDTASTHGAVTAYPNPVLDQMTIVAPEPITSLRLFTVDGREVHAPITEHLPDRCVVDLRDLARAGYMLRIETSHTTEHHLVIKD